MADAVTYETVLYQQPETGIARRGDETRLAIGKLKRRRRGR